MSFRLSLSNVWKYYTGKSGITIPIKLTLANKTVTFDSKIDTGATDCIFARRFGEELGLEVETGEQSVLAQRHRVLPPMDTRLRCPFWILKLTVLFSLQKMKPLTEMFWVEGVFLTS